MLSATVNRRLDEVFHIGDGVGANRVGGTPEEDRACELAVSWMEDAGLEVEIDEEYDQTPGVGAGRKVAG